VHRREEGLLERIGDRGRRRQDLVETFLDALRRFERMDYGAFDADADTAQPPWRIGIGKQVRSIRRY